MTVGVGTGVVVGGITEVVIGREKVLDREAEKEGEMLMVSVSVSDWLTVTESDTERVNVTDRESEMVVL